MPWGGGGYPINSMDNTILDYGITSQDARPTNKEIRTLHRHGDGGARECGILPAILEQRRISRQANDDMLSKGLHELVIRQVLDGSVIRGQKGDAGTIVELGEEAGTLQRSKGFVGAQEREGLGERGGKGKDTATSSVSSGTRWATRKCVLGTLRPLSGKWSETHPEIGRMTPPSNLISRAVTLTTAPPPVSTVGRPAFGTFFCTMLEF